MEERHEKIKVEICLGTTCFILGSSELMQLPQHLDPEMNAKIEIVHHGCMRYCLDRNYGHAPFVRINGNIVVSRATVESVREELEEFFKGGHRHAGNQ
ncbi:MAG: (2Fe-2S) ferredoxin domain-containing protein [Victivallaceae bacterium]